MGLSRHHVMHEATAWMSRSDAQYIRTRQTLIPRIDRADHDYLHDTVPHVPLLGAHALKHVARDFQEGIDTFDSIDLLLLSIEEANRHPRAHMLEKQLAQLTMHAIELQVPILRDALPSPKYPTVVDFATAKPHLSIVR